MIPKELNRDKVKTEFGRVLFKININLSVPIVRSQAKGRVERVLIKH